MMYTRSNSIFYTVSLTKFLAGYKFHYIPFHKYLVRYYHNETLPKRLNDNDMINWRPTIDELSSSQHAPPSIDETEEIVERFKEWEKKQNRQDRSNMIKKNWIAVGKACFLSIFICGIPIFLINQRQDARTIAKASQDVVGKPDIGGPWTLVNTQGAFISSSDFRGRYQLIYFGFSFCPDVCPQELEKQQHAMEILEKKYGDIVQPIYITVDPARDTVAQTHAYCQDFHPRLLGLTGTPGQIKGVTRQFRVYFNQGIQTDEKDYLIDHSIITYFMDRRGKFLDFFGRNMSAQEIADKIEKYIQEDKKKAIEKKKHRIQDA